jgi:murein DD-endopeptidase MepM/ murein hydrolase activator NlpD
MVNMFGRKYHLNPDTLRIEEVRSSSQRRIARSLVLTIVLTLLAVAMRVSYDQYAKTPRYIHYERQNEKLRQEYQELEAILREDESILAELKRKDDRLYRSIFGLEPLPASIREAGTGGAPRHLSLQTISDPEVVIDVFDKLDKLVTRAEIQSNSFDYLEREAIKNQQLLACKPSIQPLSPGDQYWLTSTFGYRIDPFTRKRTTHRGIDLAGRHGLNIYSTGDGEVVSAQYNRHGYGKEVVIDHGFGYRSRYAHLKDINVKAGERVKRGQVIGSLGSTGRSTGPHLHYEVHFMNRAINPLYLFYENISPEEYELIASRAAK